LSLVVTCMTLVGGTSRHMGETRKGRQFHLRGIGMVSMNILKRDCIQLCILSLLLTDLWILKMLEEDNGTWVTSYNCHCLTFFSCSKELLMAMGRRRELTWGHHENRLFENHYLSLPTCLKLWCQCHPFFCFILLSLKQLFDNEAP